MIDQLDAVIDLGRAAGFTVNVWFHERRDGWRWQVSHRGECMGQGWSPCQRGARICAAAQVGVFVAELNLPFPGGR